jgi:hypothetical protein
MKFTTATLEINENFLKSLNLIREQIDKARLSVLEDGIDYYDRFYIPVLFGDVTLTLVLNNQVDLIKNSYSANFYIAQILNLDGNIIYDQANHQESYISYPTILPVINFSAMEYNYILSELYGNYENQVRPMVVRLAMLVEAIRFYEIGEVIAGNFYREVDFENHHALINSWDHRSLEYYEMVKNSLDNRISEEYNYQFNEMAVALLGGLAFTNLYKMLYDDSKILN